MLSEARKDSTAEESNEKSEAWTWGIMAEYIKILISKHVPEHWRAVEKKYRRD